MSFKIDNTYIYTFKNKSVLEEFESSVNTTWFEGIMELYEKKSGFIITGSYRYNSKFFLVNDSERYWLEPLERKFLTRKKLLYVDGNVL